MDGSSLVYTLGQILREADNSTFLDERTSYNFLFKAAKDINQRVRYLTNEYSITTIESQGAYDLPADFMGTYYLNDRNEMVIKYTTSSASTSFPTWRDYEKIGQVVNGSAQPIPGNFTIFPKMTLTGRITGTASATGALSYEETSLTDTSTAATFASVSVGDSVHNITDGSSGIVVEKTSNTELITVLFGGTNNYWTSGNSYAVIPQGIKSLLLSPSPSNAGDTVMVPYIQTPAPVYSSYRTYRLDTNYEMAIIYYAAWLYTVKDRDRTNFLYNLYNKEVLEGNKNTNREMNRNTTFRVNLMKNSFRDRSWR
jgi:hypothetical protein